VIITMSETATPEPEVVAKRGKSSLVLIIVAVAVTAGVAGGAYWYMRRPAPAGEAKPHAAVEHGLLSFDPFVVNLADPNGTRFLRATMHLVVGAETDVERLKKTPVVLMKARGAILELLTAQTADRLVTVDGKATLKKAIAENAAAALDGTQVLDVLFSDFVVQF
jgi:flagellar FliL protein